MYDILILGAGPAGISALAMAHKTAANIRDSSQVLSPSIMTPPPKWRTPG